VDKTGEWMRAIIKYIGGAAFKAVKADGESY